jgi:hypothetical protein
MITFTPFRVEISLPVAAALIAFASKDGTRPNMGIGIDNGALGATDGHCAVTFDPSCATIADGAKPELHNGRVWSRAHVETALKAAKAQKRQTVELAYVDCLSEAFRFPPLSAVMHKPGVDAHAPIGFNPAYVGQLSLLCKACDANGARLTSANGELDPLGFTVAGADGLSARAAVMPMRI